MSRRALPALVLAAALGLTLAGCDLTGPEPEETGTTAPTEAPSEEPTPEPEPVVLPTSCDEIGTPETRAATVDQMTLQGDGVGFVRPAPPSATLALGCDWIAGDTTGILLLISSVPDGTAVSYAESTLPADGYACTVGDTGNYVCSKTTPVQGFPADQVEVVIARDDVWIYQSAVNIDGDPLIGDLAVSLWGTP